MKKKICTLLTLCLTLCTVFCLPVQAAEEASSEFPEEMVSPQANNNGYWAGIAEDIEGYWYVVSCTTSIWGNTASVSTSFALTDHQMVDKNHKAEIAKQVKGLSSFGDVVTWNSATDSFGDTAFAVGESYEHTRSKSYLHNVYSLIGRHGFGCNGYPYLTYSTSANTY